MLIVLGHILCQILLYCTNQKRTVRYFKDRFATCEKKISKGTFHNLRKIVTSGKMHCMAFNTCNIIASRNRREKIDFINYFKEVVRI